MNRNLLLLMSLIAFDHAWFTSTVFADTQEVFIRGAVNERRDVNRPGQSVVISPSGETRFDTQAYFKTDPSMQMSGAGRTTGFTLPLFRGQDARSSHVFVDDMELQDPYSGLPMIDDVDLRAFGGMMIHKGVSPWNVPVLDPGGVIQFSLRTQRSPISAGLSIGDVAGTNGWGRSSLQHGSSSTSGLYARSSRSSGDYRYFSDNNTILNPEDDAVVKRKNNDQQSAQGLAHVSWTGDTARARTLGWFQESKRGISLGEITESGRARSVSRTGIITAAYRQDISDAIWTGIDAGGFAAKRTLKDPGQSLGFATRRDLETESFRTRFTLGYDSSAFSTIGSAERQDSRTKLASTYEGDYFSPKASGYKLFLGTRIKASEDQTLELKAGSQWQTSVTSNVSGDDAQLAGGKPSSSASIAWSRFVEGFLLYAQFAKYSRAASLLERIGDGGQIEGAQELRPEVASAIEFGSRFYRDLFSDVKTILNFAIWSRRNDEVIRIDRVSPVRWRARNAGRQHFLGVESRLDIGSDHAGLEAALSWMRANQAESGLIVPWMPFWQGVVGGRWEIFPQAVLRTVSQFIGRMYHDVSNTRELMWTVTHDVSLDYIAPNQDWKAGLAVTNLTNVAYRSIRDTVTNKPDGRMAFSHYNGDPLPGRSWLASFSVGI